MDVNPRVGFPGRHCEAICSAYQGTFSNTGSSGDRDEWELDPQQMYNVHKSGYISSQGKQSSCFDVRRSLLCSGHEADATSDVQIVEGRVAQGVHGDAHAINERHLIRGWESDLETTV